MKASEFFTKEQQERIRSAIKEAEKNTSGEIRVHLETKLTGDILDRAAWIFRKIGMHLTETRNGVLFYMAVENKKFAIIGDVGINSKVTENFWDEIKSTVESEFRVSRFTEGLIKGILMTGEQLSGNFPRETDDINELPDEISYDIPE
ncbi:MAG TPA: TPM domain-containing protein [Bacteroidales bacterium]|nr:TPM domain-containing protein [Bacteroidales bacterium]HPF02665.1 TPM domain-containing protein [Bacteroidales bacterium]HPJ60508.1 TPM domain-containing protein [Bacteroidales bacterium]HPR13423.1 TPM domain-containing protein [Bacteroidales bacterium]HRW84972.1 TPM domain-containing protein [Bacteroidales bacterium]